MKCFENYQVVKIFISQTMVILEKRHTSKGSPRILSLIVSPMDLTMGTHSLVSSPLAPYSLQYNNRSSKLTRLRIKVFDTHLHHNLNPVCQEPC